MSQKAGKPHADPAHEAKLAARREKHALKVWRANPKTQGLQQERDAAVQERDAAVQQLKTLRDGTAGRQIAEIQQQHKRMEAVK